MHQLVENIDFTRFLDSTGSLKNGVLGLGEGNKVTQEKSRLKMEWFEHCDLQHTCAGLLM